MSQIQLSKVLSVIALGISVYITFLLLRDIGFVYNNALSWSGGNVFTASGITLFVCSALISSLLVTYFLCRGFQNYWFLLPLVHVVFVIASIPFYVLIVLVLIFIGSKYVLRAS